MLPAYLFAKPPVAGVSKTRLATGVGPERAARLAAAFLQDTWDALARADGVFPVLATTDLQGDFGFDAQPRVHQGGGDLGARLERVLADGVRAHGGALAVGADSPGMPPDRVQGVLAALSTVDAALVPTDDGGFAVLGVRSVPSGLLADLPWSCERTTSALIARLEGLRLSCVVLEPWFDVDHASDLERFRAMVSRGAAPHTWSALDAHGPAIR